MTLDTFFEKFDLFADAPNAVAKMRELVLELAVTGKLVPQDKRDQSASSLLASTIAERAKLVARREIKARPASPVEPDEQPFEVPPTWAWTRLSNVGHELGQKIPDKRFTYIDVGSIDSDKGCISNRVEELEPNEAPSRARKMVARGTVIYSTVRPYLLNIAILYKYFEHEPIASTAFGILHPFVGINNRYIFYWLRSAPFTAYVQACMKGMAYPAINDEKFYSGFIPLPPIAEQKRIVAKVDELMALCDRLEMQQKERETRHAAIARASLARFADAPTPANLDILFYPPPPSSLTPPPSSSNPRPSSSSPFTLQPSAFSLHPSASPSLPSSFILQPSAFLPSSADLRKTILTLAVQGKLVPQDPNDEPAEKLLEKIQAERLAAVKARLIRPMKPLPPVGADEQSFELQPGWKVVRFIELVMEIQTGPFGSSLHKSDYQIGGTPVINPASLKDGKIVPIDEMAIGSTTLKRLEVFKLCAGDIVMARRGEMGRCAIVTKNEDGWLCGTGSLVVRMSHSLYAPYLAMLIGAPMARTYLAGASVGTTMQNLNQSILAKMPVGVPPLAEQRRIVAKVDALMALVDTLETQIATARTTGTTLLEAAVAELTAKA